MRARNPGQPALLLALLAAACLCVELTSSDEMKNLLDGKEQSGNHYCFRQPQ